MTDEARTGRWTHKRYTMAGTCESLPVQLEDHRLVAVGAGEPLPIEPGRTRCSAGRWVYEQAGPVGTFGTILELETAGRRLRVCGRDVLWPDSRYSLPPSGAMDLLMERRDFLELDVALEALVGCGGQQVAAQEGQVTISLRTDLFTPGKVVSKIVGLLVGLFALAGLGYLIDTQLGGSGMVGLVAALPVVAIVAVVLLGRHQGPPAGHRLTVRGDRLELVAQGNPPTSRTAHAQQVAVSHMVYRERSSQGGVGAFQSAREYRYPVLVLQLPGAEPLALRTNDTTLLDRIDWPGLIETSAPETLVGPAELVWLSDYFEAASRGGPG